jgi:hypothetical protein
MDLSNAKCYYAEWKIKFVNGQPEKVQLMRSNIVISAAEAKALNFASTDEELAIMYFLTAWFDWKTGIYHEVQGLEACLIKIN